MPEIGLNHSEIFSVFYHNIFEYPLTFSELVRWTPRNPPNIAAKVDCKNGFYFINGSEGLIYKRAVRKRFSQKKVKIAEKAAKIISIIPHVAMVGLSGSLAMGNAERGGDIDIIIITKKGRLWTTRILVYLVLKLLAFPLRGPGSVKQEDRLCLNIWLDESDLAWGANQRNFYTAHEILQVVPLIDKNGMYRRFLERNKWALNFWPNASAIKLADNNTLSTKLSNLNPIETLAFKIQYLYMRQKITREVVKPTRAIFHPNNLSKKILTKISP